jgi:membrane protein DedA with SNARE-associated domain
MIAAFFASHTLHHLLNQYGYAAVFLFVMIESLGVPFPGETMVIAAAVYAGATHHLSVWLIWLTASAGAIIGDNIGYGIGRSGGYALLLKYGSKIRLDEAKLKVGRLIFDRHGGKVVFFGRFVSILRTYAAFLAGVNRMRYPRFLVFNAAGGILWAALYSFGFYYLGAQLGKARGPFDYILGGLAVVVVIAFIMWIRRHEKRLEAEAELAYPGPLEAPGTSLRSEHPSQDEQPDEQQDKSGEAVAPPLEPPASNLVPAARRRQRQDDGRPDGEHGEGGQ